MGYTRVSKSNCGFFDALGPRMRSIGMEPPHAPKHRTSVSPSPQGQAAGKGIPLWLWHPFWGRRARHLLKLAAK